MALCSRLLLSRLANLSGVLYPSNARLLATAADAKKRPDPHRIGVTRSWDTIAAVMPRGGVHDAGDVLADACIRNLIAGVFPGHKNMVIRKKENTITVTFYMKLKGIMNVAPSVYFNIGLVETLMSHFLGVKVYVDVRGEPTVTNW